MSKHHPRINGSPMTQRGTVWRWEQDGVLVTAWRGHVDDPSGHGWHCTVRIGEVVGTGKGTDWEIAYRRGCQSVQDEALDIVDRGLSAEVLSAEETGPEHDD